ncbi:hypothetical protein AO263_24875 [Pseudomonas sp. NZIPFR-PS5]|nr:hypothetical protein AO263_24875 [Pseudomonas sp. NZIPFR-PS5]
MRFRSIAKWDTPRESKNLLFFAQLVDELLFDYTLDSYKPSAMNTPILISEAEITILQVESSIINKANLKHIFDELCEILPKDEVALSLLAVDLNEVRSTLKSSPEQSKAAVIDLLAKQLSLTQYKVRCEEILITAVTEGHDLPRIRALTRTYMTTLLNSGYSARFISKIAQDYFFYDQNRISSNLAINEFISFFFSSEPEPHSFL